VTVLVLVGLYLILALEGAEAGRVRATAISTLCAALLAAYIVLLLIPFTRHFFSLASLAPAVLLPAFAGAALAAAGLSAVDDRFIPFLRRGGIHEPA
jgi:hypothetical protein